MSYNEDLGDKSDMYIRMTEGTCLYYDYFILVCILYCGCFNFYCDCCNLFCNVCVGVCMCGFCNVWVCVCVGFVMRGCVYVWVL